MRAALDALLYLLRTGCQWRQLPADFPPWPTVHGYFADGAAPASCLVSAVSSISRPAWLPGVACWPTVAIMDAQSAKTTGRGGVRGFDGYKRVKGRKRHILVDTLGLLLTVRVFPADKADQQTGASLLAGLHLRWPTVRVVFADGGHEGRALTNELYRREGVELQIVRRGGPHITPFA